MKNIKVNLGKRSYNIFVAKGAVRLLPAIIRTLGISGPVAVITDRTVKAKTRSITSRVIKRITNDTFDVIVPGSEKSKSIDVYRDVVSTISARTRKHKPAVVAIGGGVVGDLAGFVASTYRRGVPFIQIPTTLLSQVDSSVGGKVGVDLPEAKNLIGAFYQPKCVLIDTDFLATLPRRQLRNGLAEIIKYAVIKDKPFFDLLESNLERILSLDGELLAEVIARCVEIKARVVEKDEFDNKDIRIILNFGHTMGHAIEAASAYSNEYNHGESVGLGMILASEMALRLGMIKEEECSRIKGIISRTGLPSRVKNVPVADILRAYEFDKKFTKGANRFVLPRAIGKVVVVEDLPLILVKSVLREYVDR